MRLNAGSEVPTRIGLAQAMASVAVAAVPLAIVTRAARGAGTPTMAWVLALFGVAGVIWAEVVFWGLVGPIARAWARRDARPIVRVVRRDDGIIWLDDAGS